MVSDPRRRVRRIVEGPIGPATATTHRSTGGGRALVTDGPFAETREVIGGFSLVEAGSDDEAQRLAALLPETTAPYPAGIEVRRLLDHG